MPLVNINVESEPTKTSVFVKAACPEFVRGFSGFLLTGLPAMCSGLDLALAARLIATLGAAEWLERLLLRLAHGPNVA